MTRQRELDAAGWCTDDARRRCSAAHLEGPQIFFREVEHAHDARRQHQDDVGLRSLITGMAEQMANARQVAQPGNAVPCAALVVADQTGEHVRLAIPQSNLRLDFPVTEGWDPAETFSGDARDRDDERQRDGVIEVRARCDVDVDADVFVVERGDRLLRDATSGNRGKRRHRNRNPLAKPRLRG